MSGNQPPPPPYGSQPPQPPQPPGGYGAPPPQPPPAGGGYGGPPQPPGGGGYGGPPPVGGGEQWDLGSAISYGWTKFQQNMGPMILAMLAVVLPMVIIYVLGFVAIGAISSGAEYECDYDDNGFATDCGYEGGTPWIISAVLFSVLAIVLFVYYLVITAGFIRACLGITEGRPFQVADVFKFDKIGPVLVTSLIVGGLTLLGVIACFVGAYVVAFLLSFSLYFVIDKNMSPMDAVKASFELVKNNVATCLIWFIVGGLIGGAGAALCGIGILFTLPIQLIGTAYTYKKLTGQAVAA